MTRHRPMCYMCKAKPARRLRTTYAYETTERIWCSVRCAANWAVTHWNQGGDDFANWCGKHGGWTMGDQDCETCLDEEARAKEQEEEAREARAAAPRCESCDAPTHRSCARCGQRICRKCAADHPRRDYSAPVVPELWPRCTRRAA